MKKIKILVITYLPWREDNSIGNSYSNIFNKTEDRYEIAHIYVRDGMPQNNLVHKYYHISEKSLLKRLLLKKEIVGKYFYLDNSIDSPKDEFSSLYNKARILRWSIFFFVRDIIGYSNSWKTNDFDEFIDSFNPDIVFGTLPTSALISNLMIYVKERKNIPLITYPWDDYYKISYKNLSPLYWIRKVMMRHYIKKTAKKSTFMYVISDIMKKEYEEYFHKDCKLLFKGHDFKTNAYINKEINNPIHIVYMGNIGMGRWKTLALVANAIKYINDQRLPHQFILDVYTLSPKNNEIIEALNIPNVSNLKESVPNEEVKIVMENADILMHVEPLNKEECMMYRASFSTKLVDYFYAGKCILAAGGMTASTEYLLKNDAAIYGKEMEDIIYLLKKIVNDVSIISFYSQKSWECGHKNHQITLIQDSMYNDIKNIVKNDY